MKKSQSRYWRQQKELLVLRRSDSAKSSGITTPRKKLPRSEKMTFEKITLTYLLAFPKPEDVLHLKGVSL